jgi:putative ABC transport system permease protein
MSKLQNAVGLGMPSFLSEYVEIWRGAIGALTRDKTRSFLTSLGIATGTASVILVVCIVMGGRQLVVSEIDGIGANMIIAEHPGEGYLDANAADELTLDDIDAVRRERPQVVAASPMYQTPAAVPFSGGHTRNVRVLGVSPDYRSIRNLDLLDGRFFDESEVAARNKTAIITPQLAKELYGSESSAVGQNVDLQNLSFTVIGVFREHVETFGQSEVTKETVLIPYTVARYWNSTMTQALFSVAEPDQVVPESTAIKSVVESRHRHGAVYKTEDLTQVLQVAKTAGDALLLVMALIAAVTLFIGGVGVMNIMLANVHSRVREIGIRKAVGARRNDIILQFLAEALIMSMFGGIAGTLAGLTLPIAVRLTTDFQVPISVWSVIIALISGAAVGIIFGTWPARQAAQMDVVRALHFE